MSTLLIINTLITNAKGKNNEMHSFLTESIYLNEYKMNTVKTKQNGIHEMELNVI